MKLLKILAITGCASLVLTSCDPSIGAKRHLMYNHTTLTDSDGYAFFQKVGSIAEYEVDYASYVSKVSLDSKAKELAELSKELYSELLPTLDETATNFQIDFPIKGALKFDSSQFSNTLTSVTNDSDSLGEKVLEANNNTYSDQNYIEHVKDSAAETLKQFNRLSRNTSQELKDYANTYLEKVAGLYVAAGGTVDPHSNH